MTIYSDLVSLSEEKYRDFQASLMPTVDKARILGVRVPILRDYVKKLSHDFPVEEYLNSLPHAYYEENLIHSFMLDKIKDYDKCLAYLEAFLPYVDNWAVCDTMHPKALKKHKDQLIFKAKEWMRSNHVYTIRYGVDIVMSHYLGSEFKKDYLDWVAEIQSEEYYVNMMIAWCFATSLAKQWEATIPYIENHMLSPWVHKKTIQKAVESNRITIEQKEYLKTFR